MLVPLQYLSSARTAIEIAEAIESAVEQGSARPGEKLPSVRDLAQELGISPATVAAAYRQLRQRGLVWTRERSGAQISHRPAVATSFEIPLPDGVRDLASGSPDLRLLPSFDEAVSRLSFPHRVYGGDSRRIELVEVAREQLGAEGIDCTHMAVVNGGLDGLERVLATRLQPGDTVGVEDPAYSGLTNLCHDMGLKVVGFQVDSDGPLAASLEAALRGGVHAVVVTPRAQNPTGGALTEPRTAELRAVLVGFPDILVVEDDHAGEITGCVRRSVAQGRESWACVRSVSKVLGPDLRIAMVAGDRTTITRLAGRQRNGTGWVSHILQRIAAELWRSAAASGELRYAAEQYRFRRTRFIEALNDRGVTALGKCGFNVWIPTQSEAATVQALFSRGWAVQPGESFRISSGPGIRITVATLDTADDAERLAADVATVLTTSPTRTRPA